MHIWLLCRLPNASPASLLLLGSLLSNTTMGRRCMGAVTCVSSHSSACSLSYRLQGKVPCYRREAGTNL